MSYATRNENGDNMGNTFVRCSIDCSRADFAKRWDAIFRAKHKVEVIADSRGARTRIVADRPWLGS